MERPRSPGRLAISAIGIVTGVLFLLSLASWVPFTVLAPFIGPQPIERPEAGFAIALPLDWEHADAASADPDEWWDSSKVGDTKKHHDEVLADGGRLLARTRSPFVHHSCTLSDFTARAAEPPAWTSQAHATTLVQHYQEEDPLVIAAEATFLDLPAGQAVRIDTLADDGWDASIYFLKKGMRWFELVCGADDPPDDRWRSIAETFEFLPVEDSSVPVSEPQRIERPAAGFAISLPYGWEHADAAEADPGEWWDEETVDDVEAYHEERLADGLLLKSRGYLPLEPSYQWCDVDRTVLAFMWRTLEDAEATFRDWWSDDPEVSSLETTYHDLPAGRVLSVDSRWQNGVDARDYWYTDGGTWFLLGCSTTDASPEDRWLSIAETFEFLPAEE